MRRFLKAAETRAAWQSSRKRIDDCGDNVVLCWAELQGASLEAAQLQGASLESAQVRATNFSGAYLWRTSLDLDLDSANQGAIRLNEGENRTWKPVWQPPDSTQDAQWEAKAYAEIQSLMNSIPDDSKIQNLVPEGKMRIPDGKMRDQAVKRIESLDCG